MFNIELQSSIPVSSRTLRTCDNVVKSARFNYNKAKGDISFKRGFNVVCLVYHCVLQTHRIEEAMCWGVSLLRACYLLCPPPPTWQIYLAAPSPIGSGSPNLFQSTNRKVKSHHHAIPSLKQITPEREKSISHLIVAVTL
jgi:hypothetical protein